MSKSIEDRIYENPHYKRFEGPEADEIFKKVKSHIDTSLIADEQIRKAVESLSMLSGLEIERAMSIQDKFCIKCGKCCRESHPIDFMKEHLRLVAKKYYGLSYKKLKHRLRGYPSRKVGGMGVINIPGKPCPFLKGRNNCTIYEDRPLVCRLYPLGKSLACMLRGVPVQVISSKDCAVVKEVLVIITIIRVIGEQVALMKNE